MDIFADRQEPERYWISLSAKSILRARSAKLIRSKYEDTPAYHYFPAKEKTSEYRESVYVGYRYYDTANKRVRYPFGFGMSYTEFQYSNLEVEKNGVEFDITNTGKVDGAEIAQLYIGLQLIPEFYRPFQRTKRIQESFLKIRTNQTCKNRI